MSEYCVIACDNSNNWYAYHRDADGNWFSNREAAIRWAERILIGWTWYIAQNVKERRDDQKTM